jgi:anti-sigma factor RsiW
MTVHSDETVMAYVDGELDESARIAFERALGDDPELALRVARQQALRARLHKAFDGTLDEPVPPRLIAAVRTAPEAGAENVPSAPPRPRFQATAWFAMAASLLIGVVIGQRAALWIGQPSQIVAYRAGPIARGELARTLSERLAMQQRAGDRVRVGISFQTKSGDFCRTFVMQSDVAVTGVACRTDDEWRIHALETNAATPDGHGAMRQAGSELPESVRLAVEAHIEGEPLDANGEALARAQGWRVNP